MRATTRALIAALVVLAAAVGSAGAAGLAGADAAAAPIPTASTVDGGAPGTGPSSAPATQECSFPVSQTDATGTEVTIEEAPEDVVVTAPNAAQIAWELGEQERVVGMPVGPSSAYLDGHDERTHVLDESGTRVDVETVVDLDPDLVLAPNVTATEDVQALRDAGLTVYHFSATESIGHVKEKTRTVGSFLGACDAAEDTVAWMDERLSVVAEATEGQDRPSTLYWLGGGFTPGAGTFQHELIETAGADNAGANMGIQGWQAASDEAIVEEDPEYLLLQNGSEVPDNEAVQGTTAVEEGNVAYVDPNYVNQPAPRIVLAIEEITEQLHPDAYEAATSDDEVESGSESDDDADGETADGDGGTDDDSETADDGEEETDDGSAEDDGSDDGEDGMADGGEGDGEDGSDGSAEDGDGGGGDGTPGFGVVAALAAVIGALAVLVRTD